MTGSIATRVLHICNGTRRWLYITKKESGDPTCKVCQSEVSRGERRYDAVWKVGIKQKYKTFRTRKEAERFLTATVKTVQDGSYIQTVAAPMRDVFDKYMAFAELQVKQGQMKRSTLTSYRSMLDTHLRPAFADIKSTHLSADVVFDWWKTFLETERSPKYTNNVLALLRVIVGWARSRGQRYLAHDPLMDVKPMKVARKERRFLQPRDVDALLAETPVGQDRTLMRLFAYTGLRRGEGFALCWSDFDEQDCKLRVRRSLYHGTLSTPKTKSSTRVVDVPLRLVEWLRAHRQRYAPIPLASLKGDALMFRGEEGQPLDPDNWFKRVFIPAAIRAGLRPAVSSEDDEQMVGLHTLRHTYASLLINQDENAKYVSKQMGHASIQITLDLYGHLFRETSTSAMHRLNMRMGLPEVEDDEEVQQAG